MKAYLLTKDNRECNEETFLPAVSSYEEAVEFVHSKWPNLTEFTQNTDGLWNLCKNKILHREFKNYQVWGFFEDDWKLFELVVKDEQ